MDVRVALDFFPAKVTLPSGSTLTPAKAYIANDRVLIYIVQDGEPKLYFDRELVSTSGSAVRGFALQVPEGVVRVEKDQGCGCGHPLKTFNPFRGDRRILERL